MSVLDYLVEYKAIRIVLPLKKGETIALDCVAQASEPPFVDVVFLPGQLPVDRLDLDGQCKLTFEVNGRAYSLNARFDKLVDAEHLHLTIIEALSVEQQREFFRIDAELTFKYGILADEDDDPEMNEQRAVVNLSGGGIWLPLGDVLEPGATLLLQMRLPFEPSPYRLTCELQVVRMTAVGTDSQGVACKYSDIAEDDREEIVRFCFAEQRRQLRAKVRD